MIPPTPEQIRSQINQVRNRHQIYQMAVRDLRKGIEAAETFRSELERDDQDLTEALSVLSGLIDREVKAGFVLIETLLQESLHAIFPDLDLQVEVEVGQERGRIAIDLITSVPHQGGRISGSAIEMFGGSIATVQSIFLRIACILRRGLRRFLILDETLAPLDDGYARSFVYVFSELCRKLQFDVLCITHSSTVWDSSPKRYRVSKTPQGSKLMLDGGM